VHVRQTFQVRFDATQRSFFSVMAENG